ncbi:MAG: glycosyltransferase family 39 protein [Betaproteobacteria bacterium]|nr:glycosyltransferase family 39 protein [Betaproteobacteria bacterium]
MISHRTVLVALFCLAWILPGLIGHDPWKPDEAYTFGVVYGILNGGSWVVPALAGEPFLDKPPLAYLVAAASAQVFSAILPLHDAARLATGFWMALTFAFTAVAGREFHGTRYGAVSALLLLGCFGLVVRSHQLITDVAMLAGFAIAYYGFALSLRRPAAGGAWIGTGAGIAFLANGLLAPAILALIALLLPVVSRGWRGRGYAASMLIAAGAATRGRCGRSCCGYCGASVSRASPSRRSCCRSSASS